MLSFKLSPYVAPGVFHKSIIATNVGITHIISTVIKDRGVTMDVITGKSRKRIAVEARQLAMYLIKDQYPSVSLKHIGNLFGDRDHTTVIYSIRTINDLVDTDPKMMETLKTLKRKIVLAV
jgi:chromosomal replication initiator protein